MYRRFVPAILEEVLLDSKEYNYGFRSTLQALVGRKWEMEIKPFEFPSGLRVVMGDVAAGSATPSMVRSVLKWKSNGTGALKVWNALGNSNKRLIEQFNYLRQFSSEDIIAELRQGMRTGRSTSSPRVYGALNKISEEFEVQSKCFSLIIGNSYSSPSYGKRVVSSN
jgi:phosphomevalonate kinase